MILAVADLCSIVSIAAILILFIVKCTISYQISLIEQELFCIIIMLICFRIFLQIFRFSRQI